MTLYIPFVMLNLVLNLIQYRFSIYFFRRNGSLLNAFVLEIGEGGKIELEIIGIISPNPSEDGVLPGTWIEIEGDPGISVAISGGICQAGDLGTAAHAVNSIPAVVDARPGLLTIGELPVVSSLP